MSRPSPEQVDKTRRLADHDLASLAALLAEQTEQSLARGRRAAEKALRLAFSKDVEGDAMWDDDALRRADIGRWARPCLLDLTPRIGLEIAERVASSDGTVRLALRCTDGALIEAVLIPAEAGRDRPRTTLCVSSQVGCARACSFCETGVQGLLRQLTVSEIVDQVRIAARICAAADGPRDRRVQRHRGAAEAAEAEPISNIVFMGMGEPFDNLEVVTRAISLLCTQQAFAVAPSRITVSTVGRADKLEAFFSATRAELAISLNAPDDDRRDAIMPINRRFDLTQLRRALVRALPPGRRVLFQYALFAGFNDAPSDADRLAEYVGGIRCRVNVIVANPGPDPKLVAPSDERVEGFVQRLQSLGVMALLRRPRGQDVGGACGQLAGGMRAAVGQT